MKQTLLYLFLGMILASSCNDEFLEKYPSDKFTNKTFWKSNTDFKSYAYQLYDWSGFSGIATDSDEVCASAMKRNARIFDNRSVPTSGGSWSWSYLRKINIMVDQAKGTALPDKDKMHWEGVARFFRAAEYFSKVKDFGDVPWIGNELTTDSPELFKAKDPRSLVMDSVLLDLNFAVTYIRDNDGANHINRYVALALKSEICLFEGSYRKYHTDLNLAASSEQWFRESAKASKELMDSKKYQLGDYATLYSSLDLAGNTEVILYKQYELGVITNWITRLLSLESSNTAVPAGTKDAAESFLCSDGLPFGVSDLQPKAKAGDIVSLEEEFENRDPRMAMTFVLPYNDNNPTQSDPVDVAGSDKVPPYMPGLSGEAYILSVTAYHPYRYWNSESGNSDTYSGVTDAPLYTYSEILLHYAEAKAELGECDDVVLNESINLLRRRVGMPDLTTSIANSIDDPKREMYAPELSRLMWEIRRERQVELMLTGHRFTDILRWRKASWFSKPFVGAYIDYSTRPEAAKGEDGKPTINAVLGDRDGNVIEGATKGYLLPYQKERQPKNYSDDDLYLYYIPIAESHMVLNDKITQSPGWENK